MKYMEYIEIQPGAMAQARPPMGPDPGTRVPGSGPMGSLAWDMAPGGISMYSMYSPQQLHPHAPPWEDRTKGGVVNSILLPSGAWVEFSFLEPRSTPST